MNYHGRPLINQVSAKPGEILQVIQYRVRDRKRLVIAERENGGDSASVNLVRFCLSSLRLTELASSKWVYLHQIESYSHEKIAQVDAIRASLNANEKIILVSGKLLQRRNELHRTPRDHS